MVDSLNLSGVLVVAELIPPNKIAFVDQLSAEEAWRIASRYTDRGKGLAGMIGCRYTPEKWMSLVHIAAADIKLVYVDMHGDIHPYGPSDESYIGHAALRPIHKLIDHVVAPDTRVTASGAMRVNMLGNFGNVAPDEIVMLWKSTLHLIQIPQS